jgi:hypothetical protein
LKRKGGPHPAVTDAFALLDPLKAHIIRL